MSASSWPRPGAAGNAPRRSGNAFRYCGSILAARATFAHFSSSLLMRAANCAGKSAFADVGGIKRRLVSVGRYALRGVAHPQELFTLDPSA
jgi:hypothetical protein